MANAELQKLRVNLAEGEEALDKHWYSRRGTFPLGSSEWRKSSNSYYQQKEKFGKMRSELDKLTKKLADGTGIPQVYGIKIKVNNIKSSAPILKEALDFIIRNNNGSTILEIGCGSGIYAKLLRERGVHVIATDACRIKKEGLPPLTTEWLIIQINELLIILKKKMPFLL